MDDRLGRAGAAELVAEDLPPVALAGYNIDDYVLLYYSIDYYIGVVDVDGGRRAGVGPRPLETQAIILY